LSVQLPDVGLLRPLPRLARQETEEADRTQRDNQAFSFAPVTMSIS
jgi:hypothetical protein